MAQIATFQRGAIAHEQLVAVGIGRGAIAYRRKSGRLHRLYSGVYLVGHPVPAPLAREVGAVLQYRPGAILSHLSLARLLLSGLPDEPEVDVTVAGREPHGQAGVTVHRARSLDPRDVGMVHGIPATTPARMYLDLAEALPAEELERLLAEGQRRRLVTTGQLHDVLSRARGRRGAAVLRALLEQDRGPRFTRSEAERRLLALVRAGGLPAPETNVRLGRHEVDFLWREARLVVEVDGYAYHSGRPAFERDRLRDAELQALGYVVMRVTWRQLAEQPEALLVRLAQALVLRG